MKVRVVKSSDLQRLGTWSAREVIAALEEEESRPPRHHVRVLGLGGASERGRTVACLEREDDAREAVRAIVLQIEASPELVRFRPLLDTGTYIRREIIVRLDRPVTSDGCSACAAPGARVPKLEPLGLLS